jgi:hypothetical protein
MLLATRVACLFSNPRAPVLNRSWKGRFPKNVLDKRDRDYWRYLSVGDEAELCTFDRDHGRRVRISKVIDVADRRRLQIEGRAGLWFEVEADGWEFVFKDGIRSTRTAMHAKELRRRSKPELKHQPH